MHAASEHGPAPAGDAETRRRIAAPRIADIVANQLRRQIIEGELADGDLLPRQDILVAQFNVSLVSLREALRILETEGLLSIRRGNVGGSIVRAPTGSSVAYTLGLVLQSRFAKLADLGLALQQLEPTCAALAARRADRARELTPRLVALNAAMRDSVTDARAFTEIARTFHDQIIRGCGNHTLIALIGSLESLWTGHEQHWADTSATAGGYPATAHRHAALDAHIGVADAIARGDAERARRLTERHLADTQTYVLSADADQRILARPGTPRHAPDPARPSDPPHPTE